MAPKDKTAYFNRSGLDMKLASYTATPFLIHNVKKKLPSFVELKKP